MGGDWLQHPFADPSPNPRAHSHEGERNQADVGATLAKIQLERDLALQGDRVHGVMDEDCAIPARVKHRLAADCEHPPPRFVTQRSAIGGDALHVRSTRLARGYWRERPDGISARR